MPDNQFFANKTTKIFSTQGHRGCRGLMPENTIPAMLKAIDLGVTTLEMDVCISKDLQVFLSHEPFFNPLITTCPNGNFIEEENKELYNLYEWEYTEIATYDVGMKQHPNFRLQQKLKVCKPLLVEVFHCVKQYIAVKKSAFPFFNIEIKCLPHTDRIYHPEPALFVDLVLKVIVEEGMENLVNIQSFDCRVLQYCHQYYRHIPIGLLVEAADFRSFDNQITALEFLPQIYSPEFSLVTPALVKACHHENIKIIPWTVNNSEQMQTLKDMGADGIISDYPDLFTGLH